MYITCALNVYFLCSETTTTVSSLISGKNKERREKRFSIEAYSEHIRVARLCSHM